jgi:hypothetical protein
MAAVAKGRERLQLVVEAPPEPTTAEVEDASAAFFDQELD